MELSKIFSYLFFITFPICALAEIVEFNATCWDMTDYKSGPRASLTDILKLADTVQGQKRCFISKPDDNPMVKKDQGHVGDIWAYLLWTQTDLTKGIYEVEYECNRLSSRIRRIATACASILETEYLSLWTVLNACDGNVLNHTWGQFLPSVGQSGVALNVNGGKELMPDLREKRRGLPFVRVTLLNKEDAAPLPGWEAY